MKNDLIFALAGILLSVATFTFLAHRLEDPRLIEFDRAVLLSLRSAEDPDDPIGGKNVEEICIDMSAMGSTVFLTVSVGIVLGFLALKRKWGTAAYLFLTIILGASFSLLLKEMFGRPRPDMVEALALAGFSSFPSAHVMSATIVYLSLALALHDLQPDRRIKMFSLIAATVILILIGIGRVYTAVHWPADIIAGYAGGIAWLLFWRTVKNHTRLRPLIASWDSVK